VFDIAPGVPFRNVTVTAFDCCEYTVNAVAEQAAGIHVSTEASSAALAFGLFTE
jgi:hypothetical protein